MREERRFVATTAPLRSRLGSKPAPDRPSELTFLATDTRTPYVADYPGRRAGKTAHYMLRWVGPGGWRGAERSDMMG